MKRGSSYVNIYGYNSIFILSDENMSSKIIGILSTSIKAKL